MKNIVKKQVVYLGIDYGRSKIGISVSVGKFADPLGTIRVNSTGEALVKIDKTIKELKVNKVIVGVSEGVMAQEERQFAKTLEDKLGVQVDLWPEELSTYEANKLAIAAQLPLKKRKKLEDAFASAVMLQSYLDSP